MGKEWVITLDVPDHYEDGTFTVDGLILGLSFGMFKMDKLPEEGNKSELRPCSRK